jgi:hypothetical protein
MFWSSLLLASVIFLFIEGGEPSKELLTNACSDVLWFYFLSSWSSLFVKNSVEDISKDAYWILSRPSL